MAFQALSLRPAPPVETSFAATLAWTAGASVLSLLVIQMRLPANAGLGVLSLAAGFAAAVTASAALALLIAGLFHGLAMVSGGSGSFDRSLQAVAHLAALTPLAAVVLWFSNPLLWILPTLWATWIGVNAIEKLHDADSGQTWNVAGTLGLAVAGAQIVFREGVSNFHYGLENRLTIYAVDPNAARYANESSRSLQAPSRTGRAAHPVTAENPMEAGSGAGSPEGSLGMVLQPGQGETRLARDPNLTMPTFPANIPTDPAKLQQMGMGLFQEVQTQLHSNPQALDSLPKEQRDMVKKYLSIAERASKGDMSAVKELNPDQIRKDSQRLSEYANGQTRGR